jgi:hypothetical protein
MGLPVRQRLWTAVRGFVGLALAVLSVYLVLANVSYFLAAVGLFDIARLGVTDRVAVAAAVAAGAAGALRLNASPGGRAGVERVEWIAEVLVRYSLGFILPIYGATKVLRVQFRLPYVVLDTPLGDASGMALTWRFSGYSHAYELFLGLGEFAGAGLLFFRRTSTLGACVLLPILANVAFLNFSHNIPVKLYSTCYLVMVGYLLARDSPRLSALFLQNKAFGPRPDPGPALSPRGRTVLGYLKAGYILLAVGHAFAFILIADGRPSAVSGAWAVTRAQVFDGPAGGSRPLPLPWTKVYFERDMGGVFIGSVKEGDGAKPKRFRYEVRPEDGRLTFTFNDPSSGPRFAGSYQFLDDQTLKLTGDLGENRVAVLLARQR